MRHPWETNAPIKGLAQQGAMLITNPFNLPLWSVQKPLGLGDWLWTLKKSNHPQLRLQLLCAR